MTTDRMFSHGESFIVAEIAQGHDGSLGMCHAYIDALADVGVDAVKFQTHIAAAESTLDEPFRVRFSAQDSTRYQYWQRMEFATEQWGELKQHVEARGMVFLSTPFSVAAVDLLERIGVSVWKIGSGDVQADEMLASILSTGKPVIVSTGMSAWPEIDELAELLAKRSAPYALMQCTSKYPTPLSDVGLNVLNELHQRYDCRVGLSDHSGSPSAAMVAMARGYGLIEVHATFDRRMFGPDVPASLTIDEIGGLARFARDLQEMDSNPVDKDMVATKLQPQKTIFSRSLALRHDLPAGHRLVADDLTAKKPGGGIPWSERDSIIGHVLVSDVPANRLLREKDIN